MDHAESSPECSWTVHIYPSADFYEESKNERPAKMSAVMVSVFFVMSIIFRLYDCGVHTRQRRILAIAAQSEGILSILYPK